MGAQQSTRRLTVINDEASGVIKITDSVVERIKSELQEQNSPPAPAPPTAAPPVEPMAPPELVAPPPPPPEPVAPSPEPMAPPPEPMAPGVVHKLRYVFFTGF